MITIANAWLTLTTVLYAASWIKFDYLRWEGWLIIGLLPTVILWWQGGLFKRK